MKNFDFKQIQKTEGPEEEKELLRTSEKAAKKKEYRRYRLHRKIKGIYRFSTRSKTIYVPDSDDLTNKYLRELSEKFNYSIQFEIPS